MAVDTKEKRLSVMALDAAGTGVHTLPDPTGGFNQGDRQHLLDCYSGIAFGGGVPPAGAEADARAWQDNAPQWTNFIR